MSKITKSAKGEDCTFNIVEACNYDPTTTVYCHLPDESKGMAKKSDDISGAYGCSSCHDVIDYRDKKRREMLTDAEVEWYQRRAQTRTLRRLIDKGIVVIK